LQCSLLSSFQQLSLSALTFPCSLGPPQSQFIFLLPLRAELPPTKVSSLAIATLELLVHKSVQVLQHVASRIAARVCAFGEPALAHAARVEFPPTIRTSEESYVGLGDFTVAVRALRWVIFGERGGDAEGLVAAGLGKFGCCTLSLQSLSDLFCGLGLLSILELQVGVWVTLFCLMGLVETLLASLLLLR
jgi:hypothetical protein